MKKSTLFSLATLAVCAFAGTQSASAETFMEKATLLYPSGLYTSMPPFSMEITYNNQPIELIDPSVDENDEEVVWVSVQLDEGEKQPVSASILSSFGDPENPEDEDVWMLTVGLYELDELFDFQGEKITVYIPEGIVKNEEGAINPAQEFVFIMMPVETEFSADPESGSTVTEANPVVTVTFGGNPLEYLQSAISARTYEPEYKEITLNMGEEVNISEDGTALLIDLSCLEAGYYEVVIPEGFVTVTKDGKKYLCGDLWLEYDVNIQNQDSGVEMINTEKENAVYSLQGIRVNGNSLSSGLYIINGKKVIIKK